MASAISGMVMPGRVRTSSRACLERVPLPRGRPRRRGPVEGAAGAAARRAPPRGGGGGGGRGGRPPPGAGGGGRAGCASDAVERGGGSLETVELVHQGTQ